MKPDVTIREYRPEDEDLAIRLLVSKLPPEKREAAVEPRRRRWRWQYYQNPNVQPGRPAIIVAEAGGQFGGMVCTVPVRLRTPLGVVTGSWGMDFIVNPEIRGGGVGKRLLLEWIKTADVFAVLGYTPVSLKAAQSVGFTEQRAGTTVKIVLSRLPLAVGLARAGHRRDLQQLGRVFWRASHGGRPDRSFTADEATEPDPAVPGVWDAVAANYRFAVERDLPYLRWRYGAHPHHEYRYVHLRRDGALCAFAVVRIADTAYRLGVVSDFIVDPRQAGAARALLDHVVAHFRARGAAAVMMDLPSALAPAVARRYPCSLSQQLDMISYSPHQAQLAAGVQQPDAWLIARSDADQDY